MGAKRRRRFGGHYWEALLFKEHQKLTFVAESICLYQDNCCTEGQAMAFGQRLKRGPIAELAIQNQSEWRSH
jgi:hypothetical protein